jgi:predicted GIY-YIG superfamily endonuclease/uncharacterized protein YutE (UPF0331/DUF86 family)
MTIDVYSGSNDNIHINQLVYILRNHIRYFSMTYYYVYFIKSPNGKMYIGYTGMPSVQARFEIHVKNSKKKTRHCPGIENAIKHYGADKMDLTEARKCLTKQEACDWETLYIDFFNTINKKYGYNLKKGGEGGSPSEETRKKLSLALMGNTNKPKGPNAATAEEIEDAIHWVKYHELDMAKRSIATIAGNLIGISCTAVEDHMERIEQMYDDARRICTDEQIAAEFEWMKSMDFFDMMTKTLVMELVGNVFGGSRSILRRYWERHPEFEMEGLESGWTFTHTEEAKKAISESKIGKKKDPEELKRRSATRKKILVEKYADLGIDVSDENIDKMLAKYPVVAHAVAAIIGENNEYKEAIRSIVRTHIKNKAIV